MSPFLNATPFPSGESPRKQVSRFVRVNFAGEVGAVAIYRGQLPAFSQHSLRPLLKDMLAHEEVHCARFEFLIQHERIRPSFFMLIWEKAAYGLGRVSAWLGEPYAMALTEGIETVIEQHYESQLRYLLPENESLRPLLEKCLEEEKEHKHLGGAYHRGGLVIRLFRSFSERVTRAAVFVAERL